MKAVFWYLLALGIILIAGGFVTLLYMIPKLAMEFKESDARADFYSARAAYRSVIAGLGVIVLVALGAIAYSILEILWK
jgi:uncharacterized membrane protein